MSQFDYDKYRADLSAEAQETSLRQRLETAEAELTRFRAHNAELGAALRDAIVIIELHVPENALGYSEFGVDFGHERRAILYERLHAMNSALTSTGERHARVIAAAGEWWETHEHGTAASHSAAIQKLRDALAALKEPTDGLG
jgi:hypothetical protein